jgi:DNA-binding transcriptional LysR family regulator
MWAPLSGRAGILSVRLHGRRGDASNRRRQHSACDGAARDGIFDQRWCIFRTTPREAPMHSSILRYLDEVARQGSIRKAAAILHVNSTTINRKIIDTEERLGIKLFERSPEGVELTEAGRIVLEHSRKTLYEFEKVQTVIDDIRDLRAGHLTIHTLDSATFSILPRILDRFMAQYPSISLSIMATGPDEIIAAILSGEADIGLTFTKDLRPEVRALSEMATPFGILVRAGHPLAERASVNVGDLEGYPLTRTFDARKHGSLLDQEIESIAVKLSTHVYSNILTVAKHVIRSGNAIGIYTKIGFLEEIEAGEIKFVPLAVPSLSDYRIGAVVSALAGISTPKRLFLNAVDRVLRPLNFAS